MILIQKMLAGKKGRNLGVTNQHDISPGPAKARTGVGTRRIDDGPELADHRAQRHDSSTGSGSRRVFSWSTTPGY